MNEICCSISVNIAQGGNKRISAPLDFSKLSNFIMHANQAFLVMNKEKLGELLATKAKQKDHAKVRPEGCYGSLYNVLRTL